MNKYDRILWERFGMPIGNMAGEPMVGVRDEREDLVEVCPSCGMLPFDSGCGCDSGSAEICSGCGQMVIDGTCGCRKVTVGSSCGCGMSEGMCKCGMNEGRKKKKIKEVAPPGHEKMVKGLKKAQEKGDIENAYAVAWHHYNVKHSGGGGKKH